MRDSGVFIDCTRGWVISRAMPAILEGSRMRPTLPPAPPALRAELDERVREDFDQGGEVGGEPAPEAELHELLEGLGDAAAVERHPEAKQDDLDDGKRVMSRRRHRRAHARAR